MLTAFRSVEDANECFQTEQYVEPISTPVSTELTDKYFSMVLAPPLDKWWRSDSLECSCLKNESLQKLHSSHHSENQTYPPSFAFSSKHTRLVYEFMSVEVLIQLEATICRSKMTSEYNEGNHWRLRTYKHMVTKKIFESLDMPLCLSPHSPVGLLDTGYFFSMQHYARWQISTNKFQAF